MPSIQRTAHSIFRSQTMSSWTVIVYCPWRHFCRNSASRACACACVLGKVVLCAKTTTCLHVGLAHSVRLSGGVIISMLCVESDRFHHHSFAFFAFPFCSFCVCSASTCIFCLLLLKKIRRWKRHSKRKDKQMKQIMKKLANHIL